MKRLTKFPAGLLYVFALLIGISATAANLPSAWQRDQSFDVSTTGLVKMSLPVETLDAARPALEDLRLYDTAGTEVPYLIERPAPVAYAAQPVKAFQVSLNASTTVLTLETGSGATARWRDAGNSGDGFHQSRERGEFRQTANTGKHSRKASRFFVSQTVQVICKFLCRRPLQNGFA